MSMSTWKTSVTCYVDMAVKDADGQYHWFHRPIEIFTLTAENLDGNQVKTPAALGQWQDEQLASFPGYQEASIEYHYNQFELCYLPLSWLCLFGGSVSKSVVGGRDGTGIL